MTVDEAEAMLAADIDGTDLDAVRALERQRIEWTRANNADALAPLLDEGLIYVNSVGGIEDKASYLQKIRTHGLTYDEDFDVRETEVRVFDDVIVLAGVMLGHSRLEGEQQVLRYRSLAVWREARGRWRLIAWQSSSGNQVQ